MKIVSFFETRTFQKRTTCLKDALLKTKNRFGRKEGKSDFLTLRGKITFSEASHGFLSSPEDIVVIQVQGPGPFLLGPYLGERNFTYPGVVATEEAGRTERVPRADSYWALRSIAAKPLRAKNCYHNLLFLTVNL